MAEHQTGGGNLVSLKDVYDIVSGVNESIGALRVEMLAANRASSDKVDRIASRMDKFEGALGAVKWLGPTGLAALIFGVAKGLGWA